MSEHKKLGELNGWWALMFKVRQVSGVVMVPIVIALATIVVVPWCRGVESRLIEMQRENQAMDARLVRLEGFANQGDRFTAAMASTMKLELQNEWLKEISEIRRQIDVLPQTLQIPPAWWEQYVKGEFKRLEQRIEAHEGKATP
jgi:uncharacterized membrane protein